jgi:hypothetical protein
MKIIRELCSSFQSADFNHSFMYKIYIQKNLKSILGILCYFYTQSKPLCSWANFYYTFNLIFKTYFLS